MGHLKIRTCSEPDCSNKLVDADGHPRPSGTKSCGQSCRQKRARRLKAAQLKGARQTTHAPAVQDMAAVTQGKLPDAVHEVMVDEIRPLVREAMTEEVLAGINMLVGMTTEAISALQLDLSSHDETIRQRAYTLLLKYTMGNPSVAPPPTQQTPAPMSVVFNIPRPGDDGSAALAADVELRQCGDCTEHKPENEFVGASGRCQVCFDKLHDTLAARFAKDDPTAPS